jgi:thiol-disulfide isomerase/thioredoxin
MDTLIEIGKPAPDFTLKDLAGKEHRLADYRGRIALVNFWSAECPWTRRVDLDLLPRLAGWGERTLLLEVASNANEPLELLRGEAAERNLAWVLLDRGQKVADLYQAQTTPHFFVIDAQGILRYRGAYDDITFRQRTPTRAYLCDAVEALLAGKTPPLPEAPPYGCTIVRFE